MAPEIMMIPQLQTSSRGSILLMSGIRGEGGAASHSHKDVAETAGLAMRDGIAHGCRHGCRRRGADWVLVHAIL